MMGEVTKSSIEHPAWFKDLYHQLLCTDLEPQLPGYSDEAPGPLDGDDVRKLVGYASVLSLESDGQRMAYEIVSRLVQGFGNQDPNLVAAADVVLSRIGNFPGRELLRRRFVSAPHSAPSLPGRLELERIAREVENTLEQPNGSLLSVTDFQFDFLELLDQRSRVSVSAPTSAGKSFVLGLDLIRRLQKRRQSSIAYLVPTRALIGEVAALLRAQLRAAGMGEVPLRTVPFPISKEEAPNGAAYVLTQERLNALLHSRQGEAWLTTLVVDEAQGIQDDARGITLQNAVEFVIGRFPQIEIFFASPLTSNPDYLLSLFGLLNDGYSLTNTVSPVSQNIVLVEQVHGQPSNLECTLLLDDEVVPLGKRTISFRFRGAAFQQRANLARAVTGPDEATILYANDADSAERLARALAGGMEQPANISEEVADFMEFVASEIHADYPLLDVLPHGIGFHYGSMPSLVRTGVEDLFRSGELRFLCCTSTLLQGVNLPARHIVMEKPTRGSGKPLKRRDFLNLAGRAGRLLQEFHGTIWCVRTKEWDEPAFQGTRLTEIRSAMSELMDDGGTAVQRLLDDVSSREESNVAEAALSRLYLDYVMEDRDIATSEFRTEDNAVQLEETARRCKAIEVDLPKSLLEANKSMRPDRLQSLYEYLSQTGDLEQMLPLKPGVPGWYARMGEVIQLTEEILGGDASNSYKFYAWLASKWIYNRPLAAIIEERIAFLENQGSNDSASKVIRNLLKDLDQKIRYRIVKHYLAYCDILDLALRMRGLNEEADAIEPFHVYLECGASDRILLSLMSIGLSRTTAIFLKPLISLPQDATPEDCLSVLSNMSFTNLPLPRLCVKEIRRLVG